MTEQTTTAKKDEDNPRPICPLYYIAETIWREDFDEDNARCITDECAWYYICRNLSNLERIIHDEKTKTI